MQKANADDEVDPIWDPGERNCNIYYSGHRSRHEFGTEFIVNNRIKHSILDFKAIDHRICQIRFKGRFFNISIICAQASTEEKENNERHVL